MTMNQEEKDFIEQLKRHASDMAQSEEFATEIYKLILKYSHFGPIICFTGLMRVMQTLVVSVPDEHRHIFVQILESAIKGIELKLTGKD